MGRRVFSYSQRILGPEHPDTIRSTNNLGYFLRNLGEYDKAESVYRRAIQVREKVLGPEHPETLLNI
jgi:Tfp pilus assembly protein PilF